MGKRHRLMRTCFLLLLFAMHPPALAEEATSKQKIHLHPHTVHLQVMEQNLPDFTIDEVADWPEFVRALRTPPPALPLGAEVKMMLDGLRPTELGIDDKKVIINELNRILNDYAAAEARNGVPVEELKWRIRDWLVDLLPQLPPKEPGAQLGKITCGTCHETQVGMTTEYMEQQGLATFDEKMVLACFAEAIAGKKGYGECEEMAEMLKKTRIEPYGPLRNFIQRPRKETEIDFFLAIHPEDPYTFKPLLKKLVCIECHGVARKVAKIKGHDGKVKDVPLFYGTGAGSHKQLVQQGK